MHIMKKLLTPILTIAILLGDCGGMTASAAENALITADSVSENTVISDEMPDDEMPTPEAEPQKDDADHVISDPPVSDTTLLEKPPALHIGQISKGDPLPAAYDDDFRYDLPVSFEAAESLILFVNYDVETMPGAWEAGTLKWSILRGEKGMAPGSAGLLDEEDDWTGFETVSSSPYFTMEEITDQESDYFQMMTLTPEKIASDEKDKGNHEPENPSVNYDYYIRAAYYAQPEVRSADPFYAAATIPVLPPDDMMSDIGQTSEDVTDTAEIPANGISDELSVSGNNTDAAADTVSGNSPDDAPTSSKSGSEDTAGSTDLKNTGTDQTSDPLSTLSENSIMADVSAPSDKDTTLSETEKVEVTSITLSETQMLTMQPTDPGNTKQITASVNVEPQSATAPPLLWETSDKSVATVKAGANGTAVITAVAEGYATITASCGGKTASVMVDVVPDKNNPDSDKLLDLSGAIRVAGFEKESDAMVYNGQKITQSLRVYYNNTLLTEKTDYTLSYKNNVNAAAWNTAKAPSVTINLRGQYQGSVTLYYTIKPLDINKIDIYGKEETAPGEDGAVSAKTPSYEQAINYGRNLNIPAPVLNFGKKKLAAKKDFVCDYTLLTEELGGKDYKKGDSYESSMVYHYTVNGIGNYTGSFQMQLVVLDKAKNFSAASVKLNKSRYDYRGTPLAKTDVQIKEVKINGQVLADSDFDYEVCANGIEGASLTVFPSESGRTAGYRGCKKIPLKLAGDRKIKDAFFGANWKDTIPFSQQTVNKTGGMFQAETELLTYKTETGETPLVEGTDYTIKYGNAKKVGSVTVTFKGIGRYTGSVSKRYQITPNNGSQNLEIVWGKNVTKRADGSLEIPYQKNGASPEFDIRDQDYVVLNSKTDYTVTLKDNKKPTSETGKAMTCTIKGKGNYKGYEKVVTLTVTTAHISEALMTVSDKPHDPRPNKWKSAVTVTDKNGKKLAAGTDYIKNIDYSYPDMDPADPKAVPSIGTVVTAKVTGTGFYEGELTGTYQIYDKAKDIGKLKIVIDPQTYIGEEIKLEKSDIHVYATAADQKAKKELEGKDSCFEIMGSTYKNNIKTGTAKVTLHGIGEYGGTKTYSFKIQKKVYVVNRVKGIKLDKTSLTVSMIELQEAENDGNTEVGKLIATITSQAAEEITNPTVIWSSSNSNIAVVENLQSNTSGTDAATGVATAASAVRIRAKKEGTVTITATTQDGNKRAQCRVTITNQPVFTEAGQTVKANIGETYELHLKYAQTDAAATDNTSNVKWESSNPEAVAVDNSGMLTMKKAGSSVITVSISKYKFSAQCYAVAIDLNEKVPEPETGALLTYEQQEGVTDDTPYINKMLRDYEWIDGTAGVHEVTLYIPAGVYHIDATADGEDLFGKYKFGGIVLTTNQKLVMSPSALLIALPNNKTNSQVINITGRDGVSVSGGQIIGERKEHKGKSGEWGHGIAVFGSTNVTIENVDISQCWGDGIYLGFYDGPNTYSDTITIKNCNLHHNRRNNLSITDVSNVTVTNCKFNYANGADPQYGIDIEPNKNRTCSNVTISNCSFKGNAKGTIQILGQLNAHVKGVTIENCTGDKEPVEWSGFGGSVSGVVKTNNNWNG